MGFLLIYLNPALYTNVSDAWLFPEKSRRLWVTFSGAYFEMFLWAIATLVWTVSPSGSSISSLALVVMAISGLRTLFNFNPLIKLDGYYLLSDALGIPNLRSRALGYLAGLLRRRRSDAPAPSRRERLIYTAYGVLAGPYSVLVLVSIGWKFGSVLIGRYDTAGAVVLAIVIAYLLRNRIAAVVSAITRPLRTRITASH